MPRPIVFTEKMKKQARKDFNEMLDKMKMSDGEVSYRKSYKYEDKSVTVWITPEAYKKIVALVTEFSDEVGWHGEVTRNGDTEFTIEDIFVYPQEVTGSTVNTDQEAYTKWLYELDDDTFNKIRMQGHSHVNMGVSPSGIDEHHRQQILDQLEADMYYIFMIWNKSLSVHTLIYDMAENILYENNDVDVKLVIGDGMDEFLENAHEKVQKKSNNRKQKVGTKTHNNQFSFCNEFEDYDMMYDMYYTGGRRWDY